MPQKRRPFSPVKWFQVLVLYAPLISFFLSGRAFSSCGADLPVGLHDDDIGHRGSSSSSLQLSSTVLRVPMAKSLAIHQSSSFAERLADGRPRRDAMGHHILAGDRQARSAAHVRRTRRRSPATPRPRASPWSASTPCAPRPAKSSAGVIEHHAALASESAGETPVLRAIAAKRAISLLVSRKRPAQRERDHRRARRGATPGQARAFCAASMAAMRLNSAKSSASGSTSPGCRCRA